MLKSALRCLMAALLTLSVAYPVTASQGGRGAGSAVEKQGSAPFDINTVSREELISIKGVGPKLADRILAYREKSGGFTSLDDLLEVKGIGEKNLSRFKEYLTLPPPSDAAISSLAPPP